MDAEFDSWSVGRDALRLTAALFAALVLVPGCYAKTRVDGVEVRQDRWREAEATIRPRGGFDLQCPADKLQLTLLEATPGAWPDPWTVGVAGCNKRATYKNSNSGWILNSPVSDAR